MVEVWPIVESAMTIWLLEAEHPTDANKSAVIDSNRAFHPQPSSMTTSSALRSTKFTTSVATAGSPVILKSPTETSLNSPGWMFRIFISPASILSKIALSPEALATEEDALPAG